MRRERRIVLMDELRGLCVLLMVAYHALYDLVFMFGVDIPFYSAPLNAVQLFICCGFISISGASSRYSRNNIKRGVMVLAIAFAMTLATFLFSPSFLIAFGVLHLLGACMILHGIFVRQGGRPGNLTPFLGGLLYLLLFAATWGVPRGYAGFFDVVKFPLPKILYSVYGLFPLGFAAPDFYSSDYFPMLPWAFLFFAGSCAGMSMRKANLPEFFYRPRAPFLSLIGKHALVVYILHQPLLYGVLYLAFFAAQRIHG